MRYKEMMNEERIIASPFYSPTLSPLYLALPISYIFLSLIFLVG
jgi:hypothetical protein